MTFKFAVSPNAWNIRIGSMLIPFKYGWDYLWVRWADMKQNGVTISAAILREILRRGENSRFAKAGKGLFRSR